ncbi:zinc ABC transporter substrate-binding protein ZnuA [Shinella kummerowiae]|jgi:zinc transport system substrate-binding protein|uniref:High-affinity zinc uptake system protein ZnuA n=1 Tax=Shinella kummerowiae TaxID=417745 RepID=A0A6N8S811_9HYPH|nr:zinc ABC transporter substrate-binding protein ZnuA [Shinella kummerowiae]MXN43678.1 zinc ABC transporter substrate-binding protein ZnuA [Shinella kummerowiae]
MQKAVRTLLLSTAILAAGASIARAETPSVVVSIKPIHSLVSTIMQGVGEPGLIVEGAASPHTYSLKPSNAAALQDADVVFWVGHGLEAFLAKPLESLGGKATVVELEDAPGLEKLQFREGGPFEAHSHEGEEAHEGHSHEEDGHDHAKKAEEGHEHAGEEAGHEGHEHGEFDMHLWLSPDNARAIATEVAKVLAEKDPANAETYNKNLATLNDKLAALDKEIAETIAPVKEKPFIVFHDAYQYFEHHYGVQAAGSITVSPETLPGAERLTQIRDKVKTLGATCVFAEPQFEPKLVNVVIEGTPAKSGTLDPEAATLEPGPDLYFTLMKSIATSLRDCLGQPS